MTKGDSLSTNHGELQSLIGLLNPALDKDSKRRDFAASQYKRSRKRGGDIVGYSIKVPAGRYAERINQDTGKIQSRGFYDHHLDPSEDKNCVDDLSNEVSEALSNLIRQVRGRKE